MTLSDGARNRARANGHSFDFELKCKFCPTVHADQDKSVCPGPPQKKAATEEEMFGDQSASTYPGVLDGENHLK